MSLSWTAVGGDEKGATLTRTTWCFARHSEDNEQNKEYMENMLELASFSVTGDSLERQMTVLIC